MKPPFTTSQEMYNYAANQLIVQNLSQEKVKANLMERGVTDADAEIVIQNMMVQIEKSKTVEVTGTRQAENAIEKTIEKPTSSPSQNWGEFATLQEMYNYAADQLIVKKLSQQVTKRNLMNKGVPDAEADIVIKNMMEQIEKDKPVQVNAKKAEGRRMMLVGLIIAGIGGLMAGTNFKIAGETYAITYSILALGGFLFLRGLVKMF